MSAASAVSRARLIGAVGTYLFGIGLAVATAFLAMKAGRAAVAPLSSPPFRRYLLGQLPSLTGSWAQVVALSWRVESLDPKALGLVVALQFLPSPVLGRDLVDRGISQCLAAGKRLTARGDLSDPGR